MRKSVSISGQDGESTRAESVPNVYEPLLFRDVEERAEALLVKWDKFRRSYDRTLRENRDFFVNKQNLVQVIRRVHKREYYYQVFHEIKKLGAYKSVGLLSFWLNVLKPFVVVQENSVLYDSVNEWFSLYLIFEEIKLICEKRKPGDFCYPSETLILTYVYNLKYCDLSRETILLFIEMLARVYGVSPEDLDADDKDQYFTEDEKNEFPSRFYRELSQREIEKRTEDLRKNWIECISYWESFASHKHTLKEDDYVINKKDLENVVKRAHKREEYYRILQGIDPCEYKEVALQAYMINTLQPIIIKDTAMESFLYARENQLFALYRIMCIVIRSFENLKDKGKIAEDKKFIPPTAKMVLNTIYSFKNCDLSRESMLLFVELFAKSYDVGTDRMHE